MEVNMRKYIPGLRRGFFAAAALMLSSAGAEALPCATSPVSFALWVVPGFSCTITDTLGVKTFSGFQLASSTLTPSQVTVEADPLAPNNQAGVFFSLPLVTPPTPNDATFVFDVASTVAITDASLHIVGSLGSTTSTATVDEALTNGASLHAAIPSPLDDTVAFAGISSLGVVKDAVVEGANGTTISVIRNDFSQTGGVGVGVPEPASLVLLSSGLLMLGFVAHRRSQH
jgi:hypothetical protein